MKKLYFPILLILIFSNLVFTQEVKEKELPNSKNKSINLPKDTKAVGDKVTIKDGATVLLEIENEGSAGSIFIPDVGEIESNTTFKLYNSDGSLYWDNNELGFSGAGATKIDDLSDAKTMGNSLFLGSHSGEYNIGLDRKNTSVGISSMFSNTGGYRNSTIGYEALYSNISGTDNTACGYMALYSNTDGDLNTATGGNALKSNTTGVGNTASGYLALYENTTGSNNTAMGIYALRYNTGGFQNVAVGHRALYNNTIGYYNTALGDQALNNNTDGKNNIANGYLALYSNTTGSSNTSIGDHALYSNIAGNNGVAVGYESQKYINNTSTAFENKNTSVGYQSLRGGLTPVTNTGWENSAFGYQALLNNTSGYQNSAFGHTALYSNTTGNHNTAIGKQTLYNNTAGWYNVAVGETALYQNQTGTYNTAVGFWAMAANTTGASNCAVGDGALMLNQTGEYNTAVGRGALLDVKTGNFNTAVGHNAGPDIPFGEDEYYENTTALGYGAIPTTSHQVVIGNSSVGSIGGNVNWAIISDGRYKKDLINNTVGLDFIMGLKSWNFNYDIESLANFLGEDYTVNREGIRTRIEPTAEILDARKKRSNKRNIGFVAQEVNELSKELGFEFSGVEIPENENSLYRLRYAEFVVPLVKAVQEQQEIIKKLEDRIQILEEKMQ